MSSEGRVFSGLSSDDLVSISLERGETVLASNGAICAKTGKRTGRSPKDRYIVKDELSANTVDWGIINQPISQEKFSELWERVCSYLAERDSFVGSYKVGQDAQYGVSVEVETEYAWWHQLFAKNLFINDGQPGLLGNWVIKSTPTLHTNPVRDSVNSDGTVIINFSKKAVLITGMPYAGEMKKSIFTVLNYLLPNLDILPMHCASNADSDGSNLALFFGLSGTGKTTLSADPNRFLIGDDEHGWGKSSVFNFELEITCYPMVANLISIWAIGAPISALLGLMANMGVNGIFTGRGVGIVLGFSVLLYKWLSETRLSPKKEKADNFCYCVSKNSITSSRDGDDDDENYERIDFRKD